jgi:ribosome-associated toxin RatA of RatAB toxin-antitoxin module
VAELTTEHAFEGTLQQVFDGIRDYERYPKYLPGVTGVQRLPAKAKGSVCQVRYELKLIKSFYYVLNMFEESPKRIWWNLDDSNIMKHSNGSWSLVDGGPNKVKAVYTLDIAFSGFVPQKIVDQISKSSLPAMFSGFQRLIIDKSEKS